jgi:hypothetical protein
MLLLSQLLPNINRKLSKIWVNLIEISQVSKEMDSTLTEKLLKIE